MTPVKAQRVRDPVHNLIEFDTSQFESTLWHVIQTPPFQRLRRIRQLGFSEFVFPGATHTRFAHSIGVFHTARSLMRIIERHIDRDPSRQFGKHQADVALAAALLHDVGHGMFSHTFERVGESLNLSMTKHENVGEALIRDSEITSALNQELGSGFATDVAALIGRKEPGSLYDAVVSSQFDADRLDYMQRDRLMTGVESSGIDLVWLMANLEIASVRTGADADETSVVETLVLGPKAAQAAESYVLSLFHLYPNVYLHKTTRAAEAVFGALMRRLLGLVQEGKESQTGLPRNHPITRFACEPDKLDHVLMLDDVVFLGALPLLVDAGDGPIARLARSLKERLLPKCIDVRRLVDEALPRADGESRTRRKARIALACSNIENGLRLACSFVAHYSAIVVSRRPPAKVAEMIAHIEACGSVLICRSVKSTFKHTTTSLSRLRVWLRSCLSRRPSLHRLIRHQVNEIPPVADLGSATRPPICGTVPVAEVLVKKHVTGVGNRVK